MDRTALEMTAELDARLTENAALRQLLQTGPDASAQLAFWQEVTAGQAATDPAMELALAQLILDLRGHYTAAHLRGLRQPMLAQAGGMLRGAKQARGTGPAQAEVVLEAALQPFRGFFGVSRLDLRHSAFAGGMSGPIRRELFLMADAVTVLPYDPQHDRVLVIEQFRAGPYLRHEPQPWQIEAIAGRIDAGEDPQEAARREALEEAGIVLDALLPVAQYYPSSGAITEYLYSYVALADLSHSQSGLFGLVSEGEDIRSHILSFDEAMAWIAQGRIANGPLILTLMWLQGQRADLREKAAARGELQA